MSSGGILLNSILPAHSSALVGVVVLAAVLALYAASWRLSVAWYLSLIHIYTNPKIWNVKVIGISFTSFRKWGRTACRYVQCLAAEATIL